MYPCSICDRHLRDSDRLCPFCGAAQSTVVAPCFGTLALAVALLGATALGSTACARDSGSDGSTAGTTTSTTMTTATETEESSGETETSSSAGDGDGDTTNQTTNTSGSFYAGPEVDFSSTLECDPFAQDCPDGEKCVPYASSGNGFDANRCVVITGSGEPGDVCNYGGMVDATDDCGEDSYCWAVGDVGVCKEFCQGTPDDPMCPDGFECLIDGDGSVNLCTFSCSPLLQDCSPGSACYWALDEFTCVATTEDIALGEPCDAINDCALGLICAPADALPSCAGDSCCASYCDLSMPMCSQMGTDCTAFFEVDPPIGYEDVGVCIVP
jgi:hypothetical protein